MIDVFDKSIDINRLFLNAQNGIETIDEGIVILVRRLSAKTKSTSPVIFGGMVTLVKLFN